MGTWFCDVVARDTPLRDAFRVKRLACDWLIGEGIVLPYAADCFLGHNGYGFPPGPRSGIDPREQAAIRRGGYGWCGLVVEVGRCWGLSMSAGPADYRVECGRCGGAYTLEPVWEAFVVAAHNWLGGRQPTTFPCPACGQAEEVAELRSDPAVPFGTILFQWCEWRPEPEWVERLGVLAGSRMSVRGYKF